MKKIVFAAALASALCAQTAFAQQHGHNRRPQQQDEDQDDNQTQEESGDEGEQIETKRCFGKFYYHEADGSWKVGHCHGNNCAGFTLFDEDGNQVQCR